MADKKASDKILCGQATFFGDSHISSQLNALNRMFLLLNYENDRDALNSLKHMYVYTLCSHLESLLRSTYQSILSVGMNSAQTAQHRTLAARAEKRLNELGWRDLIREDITYLSAGIPNEIKNRDFFKAVEIQFVLRNRLIHGNSFEIGLYQSLSENEFMVDEQVIGNSTSVYEYFVDKGLMTMPKWDGGVHFPLSNQVIFHFISSTFEFIARYCSFLDEVHPCDVSVGALPYSSHCDELSELLGKCESVLTSRST